MSDAALRWECPFPDCDWEWDPDDNLVADNIIADHDAEMHYEKQHAGKVRIQVTIEWEELLGSREPADVREMAMERFEDSRGEVAYARSEILEEASDHSKLERRGPLRGDDGE